MILLMYHDDDCGELLDNEGRCPKCGFHPDMQSTGFKNVPDEVYKSRKAKGETFLGQYREKK